MSKKIGVLLVNLGTPSQANKSSIRTYLREFLSDPRVIDINPLARFLLLNAIILPFRPRKIIESYKAVWTEKGSPLAVNLSELSHKLQDELGSEYQVQDAMRYGQPSLKSGLKALSECKKIIVLPMYPQYASSSTGSSIAKIYEIIQNSWDTPDLKVLHSFYDKPFFIDPLADSIARARQNYQWDHLLFSYHGLPKRHLEKSACQSVHKQCSQGPCPKSSEQAHSCYRFQSYKTTELVAAKLSLPADQISVSFQSRLGRTPWIKPYTDEIVDSLYERGVRKLAVVCPSFTADCLETIEEVGMRLKEQWLANPNTSFHRIDCLNQDPQWVKALGTFTKSFSAN